jgi:ABC-type Fe3+/spermidine/putrescine transport system ATPase subunit
MRPDVGAVTTDAPTAAETPQAAVACRQLCVDYGGLAAIRELDLTVADDEIVAILGPSGSGKTTLLHAIAGFIAPTSGEVWLAGRLVASRRSVVPPERRRVGMVFQGYALWPHLSALDTVAYPLRREGLPKSAARSAAMALLQRLDAGSLADRRPAELSGGEQQRVGLARALARRGSVNLLDEPTAHLDAALRGRVQDFVVEVMRQARASALYATHDAAEALAVADRLALMRAGRLVQVGTPREVYEQPVDLWAAELTGPASTIARQLATPTLAEGTNDVGDARWCWLFRPEWAELGGPLRGVVVQVRFRGSYTDYSLLAPAGTVVVRQAGPPVLDVGEPTGWSLRRARRVSDE